MQMHNYLREFGYQCLIESHDYALQYVFKTKETYFDHIYNDPQNIKDFNTFMSSIRSTWKH